MQSGMALDFFSRGMYTTHVLPCKLSTSDEPREHTVIAWNFGMVFVSSAIIVTLNVRIV